MATTSKDFEGRSRGSAVSASQRSREQSRPTLEMVRALAGQTSGAPGIEAWNQRGRQSFGALSGRIRIIRSRPDRR
jgi:hypothetical protein